MTERGRAPVGGGASDAIRSAEMKRSKHVSHEAKRHGSKTEDFPYLPNVEVSCCTFFVTYRQD